jgi:hypothetical protein
MYFFYIINLCVLLSEACFHVEMNVGNRGNASSTVGEETKQTSDVCSGDGPKGGDRRPSIDQAVRTNREQRAGFVLLGECLSLLAVFCFEYVCAALVWFFCLVWSGLAWSVVRR